MKTITGSIVALITPMLSDGSIDYPSLRKLIDWHIEQKTDCISVVGTTGESPTLSPEEHCEVIRITVEHVAGRIPVMPGCGSNSTSEAIKLAQYAKNAGANYHLQVVPYYNKPTQAGLYQHFKTIAQSVDLPMVLYNVPGRTVAHLDTDTVIALATLPNIIGIKDATGDIDRAVQLIQKTPENFAIYSGDDPTAVALILLGGKGNISVTANIAPGLVHDICVAALAGNIQKVNSLNKTFTALNTILPLESNPIPVKWIAAEMGLCGPSLRLPLTPLSKKYHATVREVLHSCHLL